MQDSTACLKKTITAGAGKGWYRAAFAPRKGAKPPKEISQAGADSPRPEGCFRTQRSARHVACRSVWSHLKNSAAANEMLWTSHSGNVTLPKRPRGILSQDYAETLF